MTVLLYARNPPGTMRNGAAKVILTCLVVLFCEFTNILPFTFKANKWKGCPANLKRLRNFLVLVRIRFVQRSTMIAFQFHLFTLAEAVPGRVRHDVRIDGSAVLFLYVGKVNVQAIFGKQIHSVDSPVGALRNRVKAIISGKSILLPINR